MTFPFADRRRAAAALALVLAACAQVPPSPAPSAPPADAAAPPVATHAPTGPLADFAWLAGCWGGTVNQREFREHWMPLRGDLMLGTGHTVSGGRTQDFEYIRLEPNADGIRYVAAPGGQKETAFRFVGKTMDGDDAIHTFEHPGNAFPQRIVYRRGSEGWLYVHVEGRVQGEERRVIWPMRRIDCETGELIRR
jgi:hypothetical protein